MGDLLRVMRKKGEKQEISFSQTTQRLQKNVIRSLLVLPYKSISTREDRFRSFN